MNMIDDLNFFDKNFRAIVANDLVKVYNEKSSISVDKAISFDSEKEEFTSIDLFVSSIASDLILTMLRVAKAKGEILQDIEAKINTLIKNPMYTLNVIGYDQKAIIEKINIDLYYFSFLEGEKLDEFLKEVLDKSLLISSLGDLVEINFKEVL